MATYNFSASGSTLIVEFDTQEGDYQEKVRTYANPSTSYNSHKLKIYDSGIVGQSFIFANIGTIGGATPTSLSEADSLLNALIGSLSTGAGIYDTVTLYNNADDLPIEIDANSIHAISALAITGTLTVTVGEEETVLAEGQKLEIEASDTIANAISIDSTTGTFIVTTIS